MTLAAGSKLGPYEILGQIGAGGMGEVYRAKDPRLGRDVAIKVLPASFSQDADRLRRFEQEARAAGVLNHPNITAVYDIGTHEGSPYVVQELLEGETLRTALSGGKLPQRKAIDYALQIAHGLAAAHEKGIVHRDLKPENLFVTKDGRVKILDFGLAKLTLNEARPDATSLPTATGATEPGVVLGTLGYMSPEQVKGKPADARSDIFSFGAILYEMLSGQRAFHARLGCARRCRRSSGKNRRTFPSRTRASRPASTGSSGMRSRRVPSSVSIRRTTSRSRSRPSRVSRRPACSLRRLLPRAGSAGSFRRRLPCSSRERPPRPMLPGAGRRTLPGRAEPLFSS